MSTPLETTGRAARQKETRPQSLWRRRRRLQRRRLRLAGRASPASNSWLSIPIPRPWRPAPPPAKLVLGAGRTRGLGAGGDPDLGRAAAEEDVEKIGAFCAGADIIFLLAGLGGGTGTGAAPVFARVARESGALVLALVTLPFEFEGERRQLQAQAGLQQLKAAADAVICLPNQKALQIAR